MDSGSDAPAQGETVAGGATVTVRFWASARAAAGTDSQDVGVEGAITVAALVARLVEDARVRRGEGAATQLAHVLSICSVLVGDRPHGRGDRDVEVPPGASVEFLPPFAGG